MSTSPPSHSRDEAIDAARYVGALRRNVPLMIGVIVVILAATIVGSLLTPKTYEASTQVIVPPSAVGFGGGDSEVAKRQLATVQTLVTSPRVLGVVAQRLKRDRTDLEKDVTSTLEPEADIIVIQAKDGTAGGAVRVANEVTRAFLENQTGVENESLQRAQTALNTQIDLLQRRSDATSPKVASQISALQQRLAELTVSEANAGSDLQVARYAELPDQASSPRPLRNTILALFVGIFVAVLIALARDQLRPGVNSQRDVSEILGLPVLGAIPETSGRLKARRAPLLNRIEHESYRTLSASLRLQLGNQSGQGHFIAVTSALHAEGKTSVTIRLSRLLAESGRRTLVVSGDMRWPRMDSIFGLEEHEGLSDLLALASTATLSSDDLQRCIVPAANRQADVIPAGLVLGDGAAALLTTENLAAVFLAISDLDYDYVLIDAPPIVGIGDAQIIASQTDETLVVTRLKNLKLASLQELRLTLDRIHKDPIGVVVIGAPVAMSPYYAAGAGSSTRGAGGSGSEASLA